MSFVSFALTLNWTCVGITQASIPSLVKKGIKGVSVGVNNMTPPPAVPSMFIWQYANESIMATWHPGCRSW